MIIQGDCLVELKKLKDNSVDAIVTDPPAGISLMNQVWDGDKGGRDNWIEWMTQVMKECNRVLKDGGHMVVWALPKTSHWTATAIEDAGFEIRECIHHIFNTGFPKSLNIGKAVDKSGGKSLSWFIDYILKVADEKRISRKELTMLFPSKNGNPTGWLWNKQKTQGITLEQYHKIKDFLQLPFANISECEREVIGRGKAGLTAGNITNFAGQKEFDITKGTSEFEGWGTALKPACEHWILARKPLSEKTVAENCLKHGTGGLNIDGCRIGISNEKTPHGSVKRIYKSNKYTDEKIYGENTETSPLGRYPANVIVQDSALNFLGSDNNSRYFDIDLWATTNGILQIPKPPKKEKEIGCDGLEEKQTCGGGGGIGDYLDDVNSASGKYGSEKAPSKNNHPTVKSVALMSWLITLISKEGWVVLDPFGGSGTTAVVCVKLNRNFILIEKESEYIEIAKARVSYEEKQKNEKLF